MIAATDRSALPGATVTLQTAAGRLPKEATSDGFEPCHIVVAIEPREVRMLSLPLDAAE